MINFREFLNSRPLSWSAISSFEYDKEQWYQNYIIGNKQPPSKEMLFGKTFADSCEKRKPLAPVTLLSKMEHPFSVVFNKIPLIGYADTFCDKTNKKIGEYKTSKTMWTQKKVDGHGQITMYALMHYITTKTKPEEVEFFLESVLTEETGDFKVQLKEPIEVFHFKTKRTMGDILSFGARINKTVQEMENYISNRVIPN